MGWRSLYPNACCCWLHSWAQTACHRVAWIFWLGPQKELCSQILAVGRQVFYALWSSVFTSGMSLGRPLTSRAAVRSKGMMDVKVLHRACLASGRCSGKAHSLAPRRCHYSCSEELLVLMDSSRTAIHF